MSVGAGLRAIISISAKLLVLLGVQIHCVMVLKYEKTQNMDNKLFSICELDPEYLQIQRDFIG